jgi:hypothetical protein
MPVLLFGRLLLDDFDATLCHTLKGDPSTLSFYDTMDRFAVTIV